MGDQFFWGVVGAVLSANILTFICLYGLWKVTTMEKQGMTEKQIPGHAYFCVAAPLLVNAACVFVTLGL